MIISEALEKRKIFDNIGQILATFSHKVIFRPNNLFAPTGAQFPLKISSSQSSQTLTDARENHVKLFPYRSPLTWFF